MKHVTGLIRYEAACRAVAAARTVDEARKIRSGAAALRAYAKQAKNRALEIDAAEIRIRAERRVGQLVAAQRDAVGLDLGGRPRKTGSKSDPVSLPTLADAGIDKHLADRARRLARSSDAEFETMIGNWRERVSSEIERVTTNVARQDDRDRLREERPSQPLPAGVFRLLYGDPPWRYEHIVTESRAIENQYPTMTLEQICALEAKLLPHVADDAVLFLWATSPKVAEAIRVIEAWKFSYRTCAVWDKQQIGMGYYFRQQHELLLVAARGSLPVPEPSARESSVIHAPRGAHSQKPLYVYALLEAMYPTFTELDRLELFTRVRRPGWTPWTNEPDLAEASA